MSKVSIIIPVNNAEQTLQETVDSILAQEEQDWQLILVEHGSSDNSWKKCQSFKEDRIETYQLKEANLSAARNQGLDKAKGSWICFLDADDRLPKKSISSRLKLAAAQPELAFIDGTVVEYTDQWKKEVVTWKPNFEGNPRQELIRQTGTCFYGLTWMIKKEQIGEVRFDPSWDFAQGLLFLTRISEEGNYSYVKEGTYDLRKDKDVDDQDVKAWQDHMKKYFEHVASNGWASRGELIAIKKRVRLQFEKAQQKGSDWRSSIGSLFSGK